MIRQGRVSAFARDLLLSSAIEAIPTTVTLVPLETYTRRGEKARKGIPADPHDRPTVALALALDAGIGTKDADFRGYGCPIWTTATPPAELGL
jgi:predicted nucleic acid-binding protein